MHGQGFKRQSFPVAIDIEKAPVRSSLYLQMEMKTYGLPLETFAGGKLDHNEAAFATAMQAIRAKDYAKFREVWEIQKPQTAQKGSEQDVSSAIAIANPDTWLEGFKTNFDFDHVTIVSQVLVGSHYMFVWDANTAGGPVRRAFLVRTVQGKAKVSSVTSGTKLEELILDALEAARRSSDAYKPVNELHLKYQYPLQVEGRGNAGEHPVILEMDGSEFDFDLSQTDVKAPDDVIEFYRTAYQFYKQHAIDDFAALFTPRSRVAFQRWREEQKKVQIDQPDPRVLEGRYVKFVLNADPVFLVFVSPERGGSWNPALVTYRFVVKDPASGKMQLANLGYETDLDQLLDSKLFDWRIMRASQPRRSGANLKATAANVKKK